MKEVLVVCKSSISDKIKLLYDFWMKNLDLTDISKISKSLIAESSNIADKETLETGECRWFYCPAYHFCPFNQEVALGILGRASKKKFDVKFANVENEPNSNLESFGMGDSVKDLLIRGDGNL